MNITTGSDVTSEMRRKVKERIERAHFSIMKHPDFCAWSGLLYVGEWSVDDKVPTACVNRRGDVKYGTSFMNSMKTESGRDVYLNFIVLHEIGHKAFLHMTRFKHLARKDPQRFNCAADFIVNLAIEDTDPEGKFAKMPRNDQGERIGLYDEKYRGWSLKEIYDDLPEGQGEGGAGSPGDSMDDHEMEGDELSEEERAGIEQDTENALRQGKYLASKYGGGGNDRLVGDILNSKVDWREEMAQFIQDVFAGDDIATWRKPLRRFVGMGMYMPSYYSEEVGELVCAIDTSGSVSQAECTACLSEVFHLCRLVRPKALRLLYWGSDIVGEELYTPDDYESLTAKTRPQDGGGTNVHPVAEYVRQLEKCQAAIILTDGDLYGGWAEWNVPTLWVITNNRNVAPFGKTIQIEV